MESSEIPQGNNNKLNNLVAISVALIAALMGVSKIKDDNICQAMVQSKSEAVDTWSHYQATAIKQHIAESTLMQIKIATTANPSLTQTFSDEVKKTEDDLTKYAQERIELKTKAEELDSKYDALNYRDDQFDLSDALLSISLALFAVTALLSSFGLFFVAWIFGGIGSLMGIAGLCGWSIHPDWIIKLLS